MADTSSKVTLTEADRATLNAAEQILIGLLVPNEVLMLSLHHGWQGMTATYFTPNKVQHGQIWVPKDPGFAGKVQHMLNLRADEEARAGEIKAKRVAALKAELASLAGAA